MNKQYTIFVKGNQCYSNLTNVATQLTKWKVAVTLDHSGEINYIKNTEFINGLDLCDVNKKLLKRTKEFYSIEQNFVQYLNENWFIKLEEEIK